MNKIIFGCGYLGSRVAPLWRDAGDDVFVVTRSAERADQFEAQGYHPIVADVTDARSLKNLPEAQTVLFAVGFDRNSDKTIHQVYAEGFSNVLDALSPQTQHVIYISSVGVYGPSDGHWVDESSPCEPLRDGGKASLAAEQVLSEHPLGQRGLVLRLAGIYGPDRIPLSEKIRSGQPLPVSPDGYLNLIHVEDGARVVLAAEQHSTLPRTYCVSDGNPSQRSDYYAHLAQLLGGPAPTYEPGGSQTGRGAGNKRVSNRRMTEELRITLTYPSYREGLEAIVAEGG